MCYYVNIRCKIHTGGKDGLLNQKQEKVFLPTVLKAFTFSHLAILAELSTLSAQGHSLKKRCVKLVVTQAGACRRTVGRRTNHAVEGEILNLFLVWTQWSAAERHGGVEW